MDNLKMYEGAIVEEDVKMQIAEKGFRDVLNHLMQRSKGMLPKEISEEMRHLTTAYEELTDRIASSKEYYAEKVSEILAEKQAEEKLAECEKNEEREADPE